MSQSPRLSLVTNTAALPVLDPPPAAVGDANLLRLGAHLDQVAARWLEGHSDPNLYDWEEINGDLFDIGDEILSLTATTRLGLVVQTHAYALMHSQWWDDVANDDSHGAHRNYIESVSAFLGIVPVPMQRPRARKGNSA